ncbi:MAG: aryl-alcohol dehydrogenase-like predicted oxidoreductase [Myxococcota bacterium]|jgi:aryl-alcohol dehydrogenase-like predicted oxidoreductase
MNLRSLTFALRSPTSARGAASLLAESRTEEARVALADLLWEGGDGVALATAARALAQDPAPLAREVLSDCIAHRLPMVRRAAAIGLAGDPILIERLRWEPSWSVRAAIGRRITMLPPIAATLALTDPHWRARLAAIEALTASQARAAAGPDPVSQGAADYLAALPDGPLPALLPEPPQPDVPWWDDDPIVLRRELSLLSRADKKAALPWMPGLLSAEDARLRRLVIEALLEWGDVAVLTEAIHRLADPRIPHLQKATAALAERLDVDRLAAVCDRLQHAEAAGPQWWAVQHSPRPALPWLADLIDHPEPVLARAALSAWVRHAPDPRPRLIATLNTPHLLTALRLLGPRLAPGALPSFCDHPEPGVRREWARHLPTEHLPSLSADPDARIRAQVAAHHPTPALAADPDHRVRAAAMTPARAEVLLQAPESEPSWRVLQAAATCLRRPLPAPPPPVFARPASIPVPGPPPTSPLRRPLGATGLTVSPLGLTGHYGLDERGFAMGVEAGVNLMFWEPTYAAQARFVRSLPPAQRSELVILTGSYDADPKVIRRDLERALRSLKLDRISLFLIWWVRSWGRISPAVHDTLRLAQQQGLIEHYGLSTHQRGLAMAAMASDWPVIMARHSAAHRGAETTVFPTALQHSTGLITFSSLCYGRMLTAGATAADCYRYSLSFPEVSAVFSAPSTLEQLTENLTVLDSPTLSETRQADLTRIGASLHHRQRAFARGIRWR